MFHTKEETKAILDRVQKLSNWVNKNRNQMKCASDIVTAYSKYYRLRDQESLTELEIALAKCEAVIGTSIDNRQSN